MKIFQLDILHLLAIGTVTACGVAAVAESTGSQQKTFAVDTVHSCAIFRVKHLGVGPFYGRFNDVSGSIVFDGDENLQLDVAVATESIDTSSEKLDGHLKSPDFFNAREFPKMTFKSKSAKKVADKMYEISGDLTILGVTKPLTTQIEWIGTADKGRGERCGLEAIFSIKRSDFGMSYGVADGGLGDEVKVIVGLEAKAGK